MMETDISFYKTHLDIYNAQVEDIQERCLMSVLKGCVIYPATILLKTGKRVEVSDIMKDGEGTLFLVKKDDHEMIKFKEMSLESMLEILKILEGVPH